MPTEGRHCQESAVNPGYNSWTNQHPGAGFQKHFQQSGTPGPRSRPLPRKCGNLWDIPIQFVGQNSVRPASRQSHRSQQNQSPESHQQIEPQWSVSIPVHEVSGQETCTGSNSTNTVTSSSLPETRTSQNPTETRTHQSPTETCTSQSPTETPTHQSPTETRTSPSPTETRTCQSPTETRTRQSPTETCTSQSPTETRTRQSPTETYTSQSPTETCTSQSPPVVSPAHVTDTHNSPCASPRPDLSEETSQPLEQPQLKNHLPEAHSPTPDTNNSTEQKPSSSQRLDGAPQQPSQSETRVEVKAFEIINAIVTEVKGFEEQVNSFKVVKNDKGYRYLEEMLTRCLLKLDNVESGSYETIRQARKQVVRCIEAAIRKLELKTLACEADSGLGNDLDSSADAGLQEHNSASLADAGLQEYNNASLADAGLQEHKNASSADALQSTTMHS
jgi:hypothetical protein